MDLNLDSYDPNRREFKEWIFWQVPLNVFLDWEMAMCYREDMGYDA